MSDGQLCANEVNAFPSGGRAGARRRFVAALRSSEKPAEPRERAPAPEREREQERRTVGNGDARMSLGCRQGNGQ